MREDGVGEGGGGGGGDFRVYVHEEEERFVDVRLDVGGAAGSGHPVGGEDAGANDGGEAFSDGLGVGGEEAVGDLGENVSDRFVFVDEGSREVDLELGDELGHGVALKELEVA